MKLNCSIYRPASRTNSDCTNNGVSGVKNGLVDIECHFDSERGHSVDALAFSKEESMKLALELSAKGKNNDLVIVQDICCRKLRLRAIPVCLIITGKCSAGILFIHPIQGFSNILLKFMIGLKIKYI